MWQDLRKGTTLRWPSISCLLFQVKVQLAILVYTLQHGSEQQHCFEKTNKRRLPSEIPVYCPHTCSIIIVYILVHACSWTCEKKHDTIVECTYQQKGVQRARTWWFAAKGDQKQMDTMTKQAHTLIHRANVAESPFIHITNQVSSTDTIKLYLMNHASTEPEVAPVFKHSDACLPKNCGRGSRPVLLWLCCSPVCQVVRSRERERVRGVTRVDKNKRGHGH